MDFKESLNAGLLAAKKARSNKDEIFDVIKELSATINELSQGLIVLKITRERKRVVRPNSGLGATMESITNPNNYIDYQSLSLIRIIGENSHRRNIAEWRLNDSDGYPCVISYNKQDIRCSTKGALIKALSELMSVAQTGEALLELMELNDEDKSSVEG